MKQLLLAILLLFGTSSFAELSGTPAPFSPTTGGGVPPSGGGTTNFLRADGTWAVPPGSGGSGTVTSAAMTVPSFLSVAGSPITTSGTFAVTLNGFTTGSIPFVTGGNTFSQDNSNFFWDNTSKRLGVGTTDTTAGSVHAVYETAASSTLPGFVADENGTTTTTGGQFLGRRSRGTAASPTAIQSGDFLAIFGALGHDGTSFGTTADGRISIRASENFTSTAQGTRIFLEGNIPGVTPITRQTQVITSLTSTGIGQVGLVNHLNSATNLLNQQWDGTTGYVFRYPDAVGTTGQVIAFNSSGASTFINTAKVSATPPSNLNLLRFNSGTTQYDPVFLTDVLDSEFSNAQGSVIYRDTGGWGALPPGTAGQFLQTAGAAANPLWANATGASSTGAANTFQLSDGAGAFSAATGVTYSAPGGGAYRVNFSGGAWVGSDGSNGLISGVNNVQVFGPGLILSTTNSALYGPPGSSLVLASQNGNVIMLPVNSSSNTELYNNTGLQFDDASTNKVIIKAPTSVTTHTLKLPATQGASGTVLTNDGSGNLSWSGSPQGTLCGWYDITNATLVSSCKGSDPSVSCPTGYTQKSIPASLSVAQFCVAN